MRSEMVKHLLGFFFLAGIIRALRLGTGRLRTDTRKMHVAGKPAYGQAVKQTMKRAITV